MRRCKPFPGRSAVSSLKPKLTAVPTPGLTKLRLRTRYRLRTSIDKSGALSQLTGFISVTHEEAGLELLYEFMPDTSPSKNQITIYFGTILVSRSIVSQAQTAASVRLY